MKKTYLQPSTQEVRVQMANLLNGSPDPNFDPNSSTNTMDSRRRRKVWDEEEEEEEEYY